MRNLWHRTHLINRQRARCQSAIGSQKAAAFSLVELLVVIAIIAVLAALLLPALTNSKARAQRIECIADLKELGTAFQMFAHDHQGRFPMQTPVADGGSMEFVQAGESINGVFYFSYRQFQPLASDLVEAKTLICPADLDRQPAMNFNMLQNSNVSYFVGVNADYNIPLSILAGDRNITNDTRATASLVRGAYGLRWTSELHKFKGNVLFADAHVEELNNDNLDFSGSPLASSTFFLPAVLSSGTTGLPGSPPTLAGSGPPGSGGPSSPPGDGGPSSPPGGGGPTQPPGNSGPTAPQNNGGQDSGPVMQAAAKSASGAPAPSAPSSPMSSMAVSRMANHGSSEDSITMVNARETNAVAAQPTTPAAAPSADDEPEPPLLWLLGAAKTAGAKGGWWWLVVVLVLTGALYLYGRKKLRDWAKMQERRQAGREDG